LGRVTEESETHGEPFQRALHFFRVNKAREFARTVLLLTRKF